jgi:hypothetical protein
MSIEDRLRNLGEAEWNLTVESTLRDVTVIADFRRRRRHVLVVGAATAFALGILIAPRTARFLAGPDIVGDPAGARFKVERQHKTEGPVGKINDPQSTTTEAGSSEGVSVAVNTLDDPADEVQQPGTKNGEAGTGDKEVGHESKGSDTSGGLLQGKKPLLSRRDRRGWSTPAPQPAGTTVIYEWQAAEPKPGERFLRVTLRASTGVLTGKVKAEVWQPNGDGFPTKLATVCGKSSLIPVAPEREVEIRIFNGGCDGTTYYSDGEADLE